MKNENRVAFGRAPEPIDYAFDLPVADDGDTANARSPAVRQKPFGRFANWLAAYLRRRHTAWALLELSDEQLKDIGVSRCQAWGGYSRYRQSNAHDLEKSHS